MFLNKLYSVGDLVIKVGPSYNDLPVNLQFSSLHEVSGSMNIVLHPIAPTSPCKFYRVYAPQLHAVEGPFCAQQSSSGCSDLDLGAVGLTTIPGKCFVSPSVHLQGRCPCTNGCNSVSACNQNTTTTALGINSMIYVDSNRSSSRPHGSATVMIASAACVCLFAGIIYFAAQQLRHKK